MAEPTRIEIAVPVSTGPALRKDNPGTTGSQFVPLNGLKSGLEASRKDLERVRSINATLSQKVTALSNRSQYADSYRVEQVAKLRAEASQEALNYLMAQKTTARLENISRQEHHWSTTAFLGRQQAHEDLGLEKFDESGNQTKLAKAQLSASRMTNMLLSASMLDTDSLANVGDSASAAGDWVRLSVVVNALAGRSENGNEVARRAKQRLEAVTIPDCQEAASLIEEARKLSEWLDVGLRSIGSGQQDSSLRTQGYIDMQNQRTAQQQEQQQMEADAAALSDLRRRTG